MEYRRLGKSGLKVSALSFGTWITFGNQLDEKSAKECVQAAYDAGINFFDGAEVYAGGQAEVFLGKVFRETKWSRDSYIISSKVFYGGDLPTQRGLSRKHIFDACHSALKRLQTEYLDLYYCHRADPETPIEETVRAMSSLIQQGKVMYWGTSEWTAQQIMEAYTIARQYNLIPPTMEQPQYNMFCRDRVEQEYTRLYDEIGLGTTTWSPLASGVLTGKYNKGAPSNSRVHLQGFEWLKHRLLETQEGQENIAKTEKLKDIAKHLGVPLHHLAIAWCLRKPYISSVILGASNKAQLIDNLRALSVPELTSEILSSIDEILQNVPKKTADN